MKMNIPTRLVSVATAAILSLSACSSGADSGASGSGETPTLGLVQFSAEDVFANSALEGAAKAAEAKGWKTITVDAKGSVDGANSAMTNLVTKGVTAMVVTTFPTTALGSGTLAARDAGIPVASWGGGQGDGVKFSADVGLGDVLAKRLVSDMNGKGELLALTYPPGLPCQSREASLDAAVKGTDIKVTKQLVTIPGFVSTASDATVAWAAAHPKSDTPLAVWGCFDGAATGAVSGLRQVGRTDVKTYGHNGTQEAFELIKAGDLTATLWVDATQQGEALFGLLEKELDDDTTPAQEIGGETEIVDVANVASFMETHQGW